MHHRQLYNYQFQLLFATIMFLGSFMDENIDTKKDLFGMHDFCEAQDATFFKILFQSLSQSCSFYFTCLVKWYSSLFFRCHAVRENDSRGVFHSGLSSQKKWVRSTFVDSSYSVTWQLTVKNSDDWAQFVSSIFLRLSVTYIILLSHTDLQLNNASQGL